MSIFIARQNSVECYKMAIVFLYRQNQTFLCYTDTGVLRKNDTLLNVRSQINRQISKSSFFENNIPFLAMHRLRIFFGKLRKRSLM